MPSATTMGHDDMLSLHAIFTSQAQKTPSAVAFVTKDDRTLTYAEWDTLSSVFAGQLRTVGVEPHSMVAILTEHSPEYFIGMLAILKCGATFIPIDCKAPVQRAISIIRDHNVSILVCTDYHTKTLLSMPLEGVQTALVQRKSPNYVLQKVNFTAYESKPEDPCYIICTSGSTGKPKGVVVPHRGICNMVHWLNKYSPMEVGDVGLYPYALHFDGSMTLYTMLSTGATLYLSESEHWMNMKLMVDEVIKHRISCIAGMPTWLNLLFSNLDGAILPWVKVVNSGGDVVSDSMLKRIAVAAPNANYINFYGPTEASVFCMAYICDPKTTPGPLPIGTAIDGNYIYLLDENMRKVEDGEAGEICVGGRGVALGYYNNPVMTSAVFVSDPFISGAMIYKTGDFGRMKPDGNVEFISRKDNQVKILGYRVEVGEVQHVLVSHPYVRDAIVSPVNVSPRAVSPVYKLQAFVVPKPESPRNISSDLHNFLSPKLPPYMLPSIEPVDEFIYTPNGKVDFKKMLSNLEEETRKNNSARDIESLLVHLAKQVLNCEITHDDNLVELGLNSILATQLVWLAAQSGVTISLQNIFSFPTLRSLMDELGLRVLEIPKPVLHKSDSFFVVDSIKAPITYMETSLYFLQVLDKNSVAYNETFLLRVTGKIDNTFLKTSLAILAEHQPNLRSRFYMDSETGQPYKHITPKLVPEITYHEVPSEEEADFEREANRLATAQGSMPFDLETGSLIRIFILRDRTGLKNMMGVTMHHLICDGWSVALLSYELSKIYSIVAVAVQNDLKTDEVIVRANLSPIEHLVPKIYPATLEKNTAFWATELTNNVPFLELPMDFHRPKTRTEAGANFCFSIPQDIYRGMKAYCLQNNTTMFVALLSAYTAFLHRYSGSQKQFSVGVPTAVRSPSIKHLIGYFVNTLIMNMKMEEEISYKELTKSVQLQLLRCMEHKDIPVQSLIDVTKVQRVGNYAPFFQNMFVMHQSAEDYVQTAFGTKMPEGWNVQIPHLDIKAAKFDSVLIMQESGDALNASINYSTELFKPETIARMADAFVSMLQGIVADPSTQISHLPCLSSADRAMLEKFNTPLPTELVPFKIPLHEMFHAQAINTPHAPAFVEPSGHKFTYQQWDVYSSLLAIKLKEAGVKPRQLVGIITEWSFEYYVGTFAILKAGAAWLPIDPQAPLDRTNIILRENKIELIVHLPHHDTSNMEVQGAKTMVAVPMVDREAAVPEVPAGYEIHRSDPEDPCYIICTSGSTGTPKAVAVPHRAIVNFLEWSKNEFPMTPSDVGMFPFALHFDAANCALMVFAAGASLYLHRPADQLNMELVSSEFQKHNITMSISLPTWMNLFYSSLQKSGTKQPQVKFLGCGGDIIPQALPDRIMEASPNAKFCNFYGPTETTIIALCYTYDPTKADGGHLPIGTPLLNYVVYLLDEHLQPVPVGVAGEIVVGGAGVASGYLFNEEKTKAAFVEYPLFPGKLYRTGDYGRMRPDGQVEFIARRDGQVKIFGYRVEAGEIQNVICKYHEYVQDALVVPVKLPSDDGKTTYELRAFIVVTAKHSSESAATSRKHIQQYLQPKLPPYMIPKLNIIKEFPYSQNGKVDVRQLLAMEQQIDVEEAAVDYKALFGAKATVEGEISLKDQIQQVFEETLGVNNIGTKSIFDLGGNSITVVAIVNKINAILGKQLPIISVFETGGTISGLTDKLADAKEAMTPYEKYISKLTDLSNQWGHSIRRKLFEHIRKNVAIFGFVEDQSIEQQREKLWQRLMNLIHNKFLFYPTPDRIPEYEAVIEAIAMYDFSIVMLWRNQYMAVVQCLQYSGTQTHAGLLQQVANFETTGAVALSELGHGSNPSLLETVAEYDPQGDCFVLNTPNDMAQKYWCGGAAKFAQHLIVVAKLIVGGENRGLHLFVFQLRDDDGNIMPGVTVVDCGQKMGLNGVDNGRVWMHSVRVPRVGGMLDRFAQVQPNGEYTTVIPNMHLRNTAHLGESILVQGRLSIASAATCIMKVGTAIAVRYVATRNQFGPKNLPIIEAVAVQQRVFPHVARTWAMNTLTKFMTRAHTHAKIDPMDGYTEDHIAQLSSAVKPYCCWTALEMLRDCREVCGGQGFRLVNRIGILINDAEGLCTAEGAGDLLVPIFAKSLHVEFTKYALFSSLGPLTARMKPLEKFYNETQRQKIMQQLLNCNTPAALLNTEFQMNAFLMREFELLTAVAEFYTENSHLDQFDADNLISDELKQLAFAHLERVALEQMLVLEGMEDPELVSLMQNIRAIYVLDRLQNAISSYHTLPFPMRQRTLIKTTLRDLCTAMKEEVQDMADGFGVPDFLLGEIGNDWLACNAEPQQYQQA